MSTRTSLGTRGQLGQLEALRDQVEHPVSVGTRFHFPEPGEYSHK
jgi:hypothetical protein